MANVVEVEGLTKVYDGAPAVEDLSFSLPAGRVCGMVGPNGAGKTTTLRMLCGILRPTRGLVRVAGHDVHREPIPAKRAMAWVPNDPQPFEAMTVAEHLEFVATTWQVPNYQPLAEALLRRFELLDKADAAAQTLSTGMRQKLSLCCAALHSPDLYVFDEPMTGLDPLAIREMRGWVREEAARGATLLVSSHLLSLVEDLCTDLLIVVRGKRVFFGPIDEARSQFSEHRLEDLFFQATAT